jgi:hypothetical protein
LIDSSSSRASEAGSSVKPSTRPTVRWLTALMVGGIELADALDLVAEEVEPEREAFAGRKQIDDPAAHRELARVGDGVGAQIAIGGKQRGQPVAIDAFAGGEPRDELADAKGSEGALADGVDGGDEELGLVALALKGVERGEALGGGAQRGRGAIVGEAIPGGKGDHLKFGGEIGGGVGGLLRRARDRRRAREGSRRAWRQA